MVDDTVQGGTTKRCKKEKEEKTEKNTTEVQDEETETDTDTEMESKKDAAREKWMICKIKGCHRPAIPLTCVPGPLLASSAPLLAPSQVTPITTDLKFHRDYCLVHAVAIDDPATATPLVEGTCMLCPRQRCTLKTIMGSPPTFCQRCGKLRPVFRMNCKYFSCFEFCGVY